MHHQWRRCRAANGLTCALTPSGEAYCWGRSYADDGTQIVRLVPTPVPGGLRFTMLSRFGACGVTPGGEAYCGISVSTSPTPVPGGLHFKEVGSSCGLTPGGAAYCWDAESIVGGDASSPAPVSDSLHFTAVTAGYRHDCGLTPGGVAYCWGAAAQGQLGNGTMNHGGPTPQPVAEPVAE